MKRIFGHVGRFLLGLAIILSVIVLILVVAAGLVVGFEAVTSEGFRQTLHAFLGYGLLAFAFGLLMYGSWELGNNIVKDRNRKREAEQWAREHGFPVKNLRLK